MASVNRVILVGRLGADPQIKYTPSSKALCSMSIATSDAFKDKSGQRQERTEWHRVTAWDQQAESCAKYLHKGAQVYIEGSLRTRSYEKDGQKHYATEINATSVVFLDKGKGQGEQQTRKGRDSDASGDASGSKAGPQDDNDDDIPF